MIEGERTKEDQREMKLKQCNDELERQQFENQYGIQRAEAQRNITTMMKKHREELDRIAV